MNLVEILTGRTYLPTSYDIIRGNRGGIEVDEEAVNQELRKLNPCKKRMAAVRDHGNDDKFYLLRNVYNIKEIIRLAMRWSDYEYRDWYKGYIVFHKTRFVLILCSRSHSRILVYNVCIVESDIL